MADNAPRHGTRRTLRISTWLPNWRTRQALGSVSAAAARKAVDTVLPFWYETSDDGLSVAAKPDSDIAVPSTEAMDALRSANVTITPTLTTSLTPHEFAETFADGGQRARLATSISDEIERWDYDGFDLDLETIAVTTDPSVALAVQPVFTQLCADVREAVRRAGKTLSVTVMQRQSDDVEIWRDKLIPAVYDYRRLGDIADVVRVMAYDQHAPNTPAGPIAGLPWVRRICDYASSAIDPAKIELGIPLYGRDWAQGTATSVLPNNIAAILADHPDARPTYSQREGEVTFAYLSDEQTGPSAHEVWFSSTRSVAEKLRLAERHGFRGACLWAASFEEPDLWQTIQTERKRLSG